MEALRCDYCGGFINPRTYKCEYCGTQYVNPDAGGRLTNSGRNLLVVAKTAPTEIYGIRQEVTLEQLDMMQRVGVPIEHEIRRSFASQIAEAIAEKIDIYEDYDICRNVKQYSAKLRIVKPDYRF